MRGIRPIRTRIEIEDSYLISGPDHAGQHGSGQKWEAYVFAQRVNEYRSTKIGRRNFVHMVSAPDRQALSKALWRWIRAERVIVVARRSA